MHFFYAHVRVIIIAHVFHVHCCSITMPIYCYIIIIVIFSETNTHSIPNNRISRFL